VSAPIKEVKRINAVIIHLNQQIGFALQHNSYAMDVDKRNMNCYNCGGGFEHSARNCRNRGTEGRIGESRRLEYRNNG